MIYKLKEAIHAEDTVLANRTMHTLKSTARLIGAEKLAQAASDMELLLSSGETSCMKEQMQVLGDALQELFEVLNPLSSESETNPTETARVLNKEAAISLIDKLEPLLDSGNPESIRFIEEIREILSPMGKICDTLIILIKDYEFDMALQILRHMISLVSTFST